MDLLVCFLFFFPLSIYSSQSLVGNQDININNNQTITTNVKYIKNSQSSRGVQSSKVTNNYLSSETIPKFRHSRLTKETIINQPHKNKFKHINENPNKGQKKRGHISLKSNNQKDTKQKVHFSNQSIPKFVRWRRNNLKPIKTEVKQFLKNYEKNQGKKKNVNKKKNNNLEQEKKKKQKKNKHINVQSKNYKKAKKVFGNIYQEFSSSNQSHTNFQRWSRTGSKPIIGAVKRSSKNQFKTEKKLGKEKVKKQQNDEQEHKEIGNFSNKENNKQQDNKEKKKLFVNKTMRTGLKPIKSTVSQFLKNQLITKKRHNDKKQEPKEDKNLFVKKDFVENYPSDKKQKYKEVKNLFINKDLVKNIHQKVPSPNQTISNFKRWGRFGQRRAGSKPLKKNQFLQNQFMTEKKQQNNNKHNNPKLKNKEKDENQDLKKLNNLFANGDLVKNMQQKISSPNQTIPSNSKIQESKVSNKRRKKNLIKNLHQKVLSNKTIPNSQRWRRVNLKPIKTSVKQFLQNQRMAKQKQQNKIQQERKKKSNLLFNKENGKHKPKENNLFAKEEELKYVEELVKNIHQKEKKIQDKEQEKQFMGKKKRQNNTKERKKKGNLFFNKGNDQKQKFKEVKNLLAKEDLVKILQDEKEKQFMAKKQESNLQKERKKKSNLLFNKENGEQKPKETKIILIKEDLVKNMHQKAPSSNQAFKNQFKENKIQDIEQEKQFLTKKKQKNNTQELMEKANLSFNKGNDQKQKFKQVKNLPTKQDLVKKKQESNLQKEREKKSNLLFNKENGKQKPKETKNTFVKEDLVKNMHQKVSPSNQAFKNQFKENKIQGIKQEKQFLTKKQKNNTQKELKEKANLSFNKGNDQNQKFKQVKNLPTKEELVKILHQKVSSNFKNQIEVEDQRKSEFNNQDKQQEHKGIDFSNQTIPKWMLWGHVKKQNHVQQSLELTLLTKKVNQTKRMENQNINNALKVEFVDLVEKTQFINNTEANRLSVQIQSPAVHHIKIKSIGNSTNKKFYEPSQKANGKLITNLIASKTEFCPIEPSPFLRQRIPICSKQGQFKDVLKSYIISNLQVFQK